MEYLQWLVILFLLFGQRKIYKQIMIHKSRQIAAKDSGRKIVLLLWDINFSGATDLHS